jgi:CheY-like chemotaxis protein
MAVILVADDDPLIRTMMQKLLTRVGHTVLQAATGLEAELVVADQTIDVLITDIIMPDKEGLTLVRDLHKKLPHLKIIAMSGGGRSGAFTVLDAAAQFGANTVLRKPFRGTELIEAVAGALGQPVSAMVPAATNSPQ